MRAAIYARYSSENQREASIEDQVRTCKARAKVEGWRVVQVYSDAAISGATTLRPGYQQLLQDARDGELDIVLAESLDRLSRDLEDVAALYKLLTFADIKLVTLADGEISELHVGLKGTMNALYLKDLAQKTHRGLEGRVRQGRSAGGISYGYRTVKEYASDGEPIKGKREIVPEQAQIVRRIFTAFAAGKGPRAIARELNLEGVTGPGGRQWGDTTIRGHHSRHTGILRNELYVGRLVWNRLRYIKDPSTGKRVSRLNPENEWICEEVPEQRIVDDALWDRVQARLQGIRQSEGVTKIRKSRFWEHRRKKHLLTGLIVCGDCDGLFTAAGRNYLACGTARRNGTCENRRSIKREALEEIILDALKRDLMQPQYVEEFIRAYHTEINSQAKEQDKSRDRLTAELANVTRKLDGLIDAIADGLRAEQLQQKLDDLEARKQALSEQLSGAPESMPRLHPNLASLYRRKVEHLHEALQDPAIRTEALELIRPLIERVIMRPVKDGFEIELVGAIANMLRLSQAPSTEPKNGTKPAAIAADVDDPFVSSVKVVAGARNQRYLHLDYAALKL